MNRSDLGLLLQIVIIILLVLMIFGVGVTTGKVW